MISAQEQALPPARSHSDLPFIWKFLFCLVLLAALAIRVRAAFNDLWVDEILSLSLAQSVASPLEIITKLHHDNNHPLNTLSMYLMGLQDQWLVYRLPAVLAGTATVCMAGAIGWLRGRLEALTTMILTGGSYLLIHYSSEARGYGFVTLFLLTGYYAALRYAGNPTWRWTILFWLSCILGLLSHLAFLHFYLAIFCWTVYRLIKKHGVRKDTLISLASLHWLPVLFLGLFYWVHLRHIVFRGGD